MSKRNDMKIIITKQLFNSIQPIVELSRVFGLAPVGYKKIGDLYGLNFSYRYVTYSYILGLLLAGTALVGLATDIRAKPEDSLRIKDRKGAYVVSCDLGLTMLIVILGIFISPFKLEKFFIILESLNTIHLNLASLDKRNERKFSIIISSISHAMFLSVLVYDCVGWYIQTEGKASAHQLWKNIPVYILYIVTMTQEIFYWNITYFVKRCVISYNTYLEECLGSREKTVGLKEPLGLGKHDVLEKYQCQAAGRDNVVSVKEAKCRADKLVITQNVLTTEKATLLTDLHKVLFEVVNLINDWYGIPLLLILLSCFLQLIATPYFMISNNSSKSMVFSILEFIWLFAHASRLLIVVEASHHCLKEYDKTNYLLCLHLKQKYDYEVMQQLEQLALQIKTCKVKFSTFGVAELDRSILASVAGAVTTYLVILLQLNVDAISNGSKTEATIQP